MYDRKLAFVLSAGHNQRLGDTPPGGKAHLKLSDGTPWEQASTLLKRYGYTPWLVELDSNQSGSADVLVHNTHGPAWAVREAMDWVSMQGLAWDSFQLLVWYGDTVMSADWVIPERNNFVVCADVPPRYDRNWDWVSGKPAWMSYQMMAAPKKRKFKYPPLRCPAVGIYHMAYPELWASSFSAAVPEYESPGSGFQDSYTGPEIGMALPWNTYAKRLQQEMMITPYREVVPLSVWRDVGDKASLSAYE